MVTYMTILVQKELDDTLLGFDKMPWTWMHDEKQHIGWKALYQIYFYLSNHILQDVLKEKSVIALLLRLE